MARVVIGLKKLRQWSRKSNNKTKGKIMSNEIVKVFEDQVVRIHDRNGEPWFVAKDVCGVLGLVNPTEALRALDDDEKNTLRITEGIRRGNPEINIISESGLYKLVMRSRKPAAKKFVKWVTSEVLPAIRRNGAYVHEAAKYEDVLRAVLEAQDRHVGQVIQQNVELKAEVRYLKLFEPHGEPGDVSDITGLPKINWQRGRWTSGRGRSYQVILKAIQTELPGLFESMPLRAPALASAGV